LESRLKNLQNEERKRANCYNKRTSFPNEEKSKTLNCIPNKELSKRENFRFNRRIRQLNEELEQQTQNLKQQQEELQ
jgi:hypothetical protein